MINSFKDDYRFLSNFWPCTVNLDGWWYPSVEHAYQAAKCLMPERGQFNIRMTAGQAKRLGQKIALRPDWEQIKLEVMATLLIQKFAKGSHLGNKLLATAPHELIEGNTWGDVYWGVCEGKGENNLGKLLMLIREDIA